MNQPIDHASVSRAVGPYLAMLADDLLPVTPLNDLAAWWLNLGDVERWSFANRMLAPVAPKCSALTVCGAVIALDDAARERLASREALR